MREGFQIILSVFSLFVSILNLILLVLTLNSSRFHIYPSTGVYIVPLCL
nr:MAG TPA: hypothetical protein [Crassvirales sp.]